ncbi:hypothetical protein HPP92_001749 [Vanilla planifolia]|uniref:Uncharacterized protein n=1 Tax=Vanilla planifolia TaxID=51239 RepID=A0A835SDF8_VANPL|nr:hypothetical protein HPP92_001749 [Vanilla planifolia]
MTASKAWRASAAEAQDWIIERWRRSAGTDGGVEMVIDEGREGGDPIWVRASAEALEPKAA